MQRATMASNPDDTDGLACEGGSGVEERTRLQMPWSESASNGRLPVTISYRTTPREKRSERASWGLPMICSGHQYAGVPSSGVAPVARLASRAMPKSINFTWPSSGMSTLARFAAGQFLGEKLDGHKAADHGIVGTGHATMGTGADDFKNFVASDLHVYHPQLNCFLGKVRIANCVRVVEWSRRSDYEGTVVLGSKRHFDFLTFRPSVSGWIGVAGKDFLEPMRIPPHPRVFGKEYVID